MKYRSRIIGALTCVAAVFAVVTIRFARDVFVGMIERMGGSLVDVSRLTAVALDLTSTPAIVAFGLAGFAAVVVAELRAVAESSRLTVHSLVLSLLLALLLIALSGFFIAFHIPNVRIP